MSAFFPLSAYSQSLAEELRHDNVFVTTLYPDVVDTDMSAAANMDNTLMIPASDVAKPYNLFSVCQKIHSSEKLH